MKAKIGLVTLGVASLERAVTFYRDGMGLPLHGDEPPDGIAFFEMEGTWLALFPRDKLAEDAGVEAVGTGFSGITLAHNEASPAAVDSVYAAAIAAGARAVKMPAPTFWGGYSGYFADPDGHLWEVAHNPFMDLT